MAMLEGPPWPTIEEIAEKYGLPDTAVIAVLDGILAAHKYITEEKLNGPLYVEIIDRAVGGKFGEGRMMFGIFVLSAEQAERIRHEEKTIRMIAEFLAGDL